MTNSAECELLAQDQQDFEETSSGFNRKQWQSVISLSSLTLSNFRNYEYARLEVSAEPVVLTGVNGAGKTNILEAVSLLTVGRGLRKARLSEIDSRSGNLEPDFGAGKNGWAISANVNGRYGVVKIGTGRVQDGSEDSDKRIVKIDGKIIRGQAELASHISMIWLTPQMEQLFSEGSSAGRKFLDRLVFSFDPQHATRINEYEYAMRERNKLLQYGRADAGWLDSLEHTMSGCAASIAIARLTACEHINHTIASSTLSFPKALVDVSGFAEDMVKQGRPATEVEQLMKEAFAKNRGQDAVAGRSLLGTHRSELNVTHILKNMPAHSCSMGEQKALMLSIILAQARSGARWHGITPVMLLDEVAGHLDEKRRYELFEEICDIGAQVWMTGTERHLFAGLENKASFFVVDNGKISS